MSWNLKCRRMQKFLALWAGGDIESHERSEAERHMAVCPCCRERWIGLQSGQQALDDARATSAANRGCVETVWPAVYRQIRSLEVPPTAPHWHGWLPAGALAAACLAVIMTLAPGFGPNPDGTASRAPVIIDVHRVDSPAPGSFDDPADQGPYSRTPERWRWPAENPPEETRVRTLLNGTDIRDL